MCKNIKEFREHRKAEANKAFKSTQKALKEVEFNWKSVRAKQTICHLHRGTLQSVGYSITVESEKVTFVIDSRGVQIDGFARRNHLKIISAIMLQIEKLFE